jgi:dephospho-CoA kinase
MHTLSKGIKIGLTGSIASGKSTALDVFAQSGFQVFSADQAVSELYHDDGFVMKVKEIFPHIIVHDVIDKTLLIQSLSDAQFYERYIHLVHDGVLVKMLTFFQNIEDQNCVCEIPLLFEAQWQKYFDEVWCIVVSESLSHKRALLRGMSESTYQFLKEKQWSIEEKCAQADVLVHNENTKEDFIVSLTQLIKERTS